MTEEARALLRDECETDAWMDEWDCEEPDEDTPIAECENCGSGIYVYDSPLGLVHREANGYQTMYLCKDCYKKMHVTDILTLLDIMYFEPLWEDDGERVIDKTSQYARKMNEMHRAALRQQIDIAANMVKGVRA